MFRSEHIELNPAEYERLNSVIDEAPKDVAGAFVEACRKLLTRRGVGGAEPPFEIKVGCGGRAVRLCYLVRAS